MNAKADLTPVAAAVGSAGSATSDEIAPNMLRLRWGDALDAGFVSVPRVLFTRQRELGLESGQVVLLMNLVASWWADGKAPYPAINTLAHRMQVSERTIQRLLAALEEKGFIKKVRGTSGDGRAADHVVTRYQLDGLVRRLLEVSKAAPPTPLPRRRRASPHRSGTATAEVLPAN